MTHSKPPPESLLALKHPSIEKIRRGIDDNLSNHIILQMSSSWSDKYLEESRDKITKRILNDVISQLDNGSQEWISSASIHAHRWRYARPKEIPKQVDIERITFAGDAWNEPVGTIEAAIESSKWAVAELLWNLNSNIKKTKTGYQTSLF